MLRALIDEDDARQPARPAKRQRRTRPDPGPDGADPCGEPSGDEASADMPPFRKWLLMLYAKGKLSAQQVTEGPIQRCLTTFHWALAT
jgi:hypothetical protein